MIEFLLDTIQVEVISDKLIINLTEELMIL
jgi:hypothetical protein